MDGANYEKLIATGFKIFRKNDQLLKITECAGFGRWKAFGGPYKSKADLKRNWKVLMDHPKCLGD